MSRTKGIVRNVRWLSEEIPSELNFYNSFRFYQKFQFKDIIGEIGDYVLISISNTDAAEPDTEGGCDAAKILTLYEDQSNKNDPFRAKVQWYSRPSGLPKACNMDNIVFYDREVIEDHRPFHTDVSIETIYKKIDITFTFTKDTDETLNEKMSYICRHRLMPVGRKKYQIEPVLDDERKALQLLTTPSENNVTPIRSVTRRPVYCENYTSPVKRPLRGAVMKNYSSSDVPKPPKVPKSRKTARTPKTPRTPKTRTSVTKTPKSVKRILTSQLTPTLPMRTHSVGNIEENKSLPGREKQMQEILSFVRSKLLNSVGGCMYISGKPGTGKTATVNSALKVLKEEPDVPEFQLVQVNGMGVAGPRQAYVQIYKQLTGKSVLCKEAYYYLLKRFETPAPRRKRTVLVIEELDALCNRRQDFFYNIVKWANHDTALLTVLAIANTVNLPEQVLGLVVASRLGITRVTFPPYTPKQLQRIIAMSPPRANVTADAVHIIASKVAAVWGDARRALSLYSRASEIAGPNCVGLEEIEEALGEVVSGAAVRAIRNCSPAEKLMLRAVAAEAERTGSDVTTFSRALAAAAHIVSSEGRPCSSPSTRSRTLARARTICARLAASKLLLMEPEPFEPRLSLNVCVDDVNHATKYCTHCVI